MVKFQTWTRKGDNSTSASPSTPPVQSAKETSITPSPDSNKCNTSTSDLPVQIGCNYNNFRMVTIGLGSAIHFFYVGLIYFYPDAFPGKQKDPVSGLETEQTLKDSVLPLMVFPTFVICVVWLGSIIKIIRYTAGVKGKPEFDLDAYSFEAIAFGTYSFFVMSFSPMLIGIFLANLAWPFFCFGLWISFKIIQEVSNHEIYLSNNSKPTDIPILGTDGLYLHEPESMPSLCYIYTGDEIRQMQIEAFERNRTKCKK